MIWNIIVDSSCDLKTLNYRDAENEVRYVSVPFVISVGSKDYIDDDTIKLPELLDAMETSKEASRTACPGPGAWLAEFENEGNIIAITISKELSGSYNSANAAKDMILERTPGRNIEIINSVSAGAGPIVIIHSILDAIKANKSFEEVVAAANQANKAKETVFALCSYRNLIKNGRISALAGFLAQRLNLWGIGIATPIGTLHVKEKVRGPKRMLDAIVRDIQERNGSARRITISHCENAEMAEKLKEKILETYADAVVDIHETKGLCSYYAERHGLVVSYL